MYKTFIGAIAALTLLTTPALAQQDDGVDVQAGGVRVQVDGDRDAQAAQQNQRLIARAMRVSQLMDLDVVGLQNEEIGDVEDIVLDLETGQVRYVALSFGSTLGLGGKLVAIPWNAFQVKQHDDQWVLVVNATAAKFENAPGFNEENWPDFADQNWQAANDRFYNEQGVTTGRYEVQRAPTDEADVPK